MDLLCKIWEGDHRNRVRAIGMQPGAFQVVTIQMVINIDFIGSIAPWSFAIRLIYAEVTEFFWEGDHRNTLGYPIMLIGLCHN